jgi:plastocyanin
MRTIIVRKYHRGLAMKRLLLLTLLLPLSAFSAGLLLVSLLHPLEAEAEDAGYQPDFKLVIDDHRFQPIELKIPSGTKIKLVIENHDATPEEFESHALNREKVIAGYSTATIYIGPLAPGRYPFTGEFHESTAQGVIIAQ